MNRPAPTEYADYYAGYIGGVPDGDILTLLQSELDRTSSLLRALTPEQAKYLGIPAEGPFKPDFYRY